MKLLKKIGSVILMLLLILTMFPAGTVTAVELPKIGSLSMLDVDGNLKSTSAYSAYKIVSFDASQDSNGDTFYNNMKIINADYKDVLAKAVGLTTANSDKEILAALNSLNDSNMAKLAIDLQDKAKGYPTDATTTEGKFENLNIGYYLVIETVNNAQDGSVISKPILVSVPDAKGIMNVTVKVKPSKAGIEKKINENGILVDSSTAAVGDTVNYQSLSGIPSYPTYATGITYYITDTFSQGLTFDATSIVAQIVPTNGPNVSLTLGTDFTLETTGIGSATFRLSLIKSEKIIEWGNAGSKLLVTYNAKVNENATYGITGNPNSVKLTYSKVPGEYTTKQDTVITYTELLIVTKTEKDSSKALSGASFELYKMDGSGDILKDTQVTDGNGKAYFRKLEQGTYKLKEIKAPAGYDLLLEDTVFVVTAQNGLTPIPNTSIICNEEGNANAADKFKATWVCPKFTVDTDGKLLATIENSKGFILPGTGGSGTKMFTICGIAIVLLGCGMAFIYFKKKKTLKHQ